MAFLCGDPNSRGVSAWKLERRVPEGVSAKRDVLRTKRDVSRAERDVSRAKRDVSWAKRDVSWAERDVLWAKRPNSWAPSPDGVGTVTCRCGHRHLPVRAKRGVGWTLRTGKLFRRRGPEGGEAGWGRLFGGFGPFSGVSEWDLAFTRSDFTIPRSDFRNPSSDLANPGWVCGHTGMGVWAASG